MEKDELPPSVIFNSQGVKSLSLDSFGKGQFIERYRLVNSRYEFDCIIITVI